MALDIGAEVGQKMRSAIKAKLLELNCYVDDELPDYIMVMVANKRTKSQMKDDLQLFLNTKTSPFVEWLYIVLKKLKEVTVTNPEVYKKTTAKRNNSSGDESVSFPLKKEKKEKKKIKEEVANKEVEKSLTDDLPMSANKLSEQRKIIVMRENRENQQQPVVDNFDIPLLSEVNMSTEEELEDIEQKIKTVKSRLGLLVKSDDEEEKEKSKTVKKPITFENKEPSPKRKSVHERLGKRKSQEDSETSNKRVRIDLDEFRKEVTKSTKQSRLKNRLGVKSRISVPLIKEKDKTEKAIPAAEEEEEEEEEQPIKNREVASVVKIKPRVIPEGSQPNKNLLLKAVAEAQRSIAQTPSVGSKQLDGLFTKKFKEARKLLGKDEKNKIKKLLTDGGGDGDDYISTSTKLEEESESYNNDQFENGKIKMKYTNENKPSIKSRLDRRKSPSPIIFDRTSPIKNKTNNIPDKLPIVSLSSLKNKERCKYWPSCRQGDKCEFVHPSANCEMFPRCKFADKCLYLHPSCKFGSSCTRRDCSYSHISLKASRVGNLVKSTLQVCKYFPNCTNINCTFYHPKMCKFGQFCKNQSECNFTHATQAKSSLTWRSK